MGISAYLIWQKGMKHKEVKRALSVFGIQLILNALWSILFFGMHNPGIALVDIIAMLVAITWTILRFGKLRRSAAWLLVPYLLWVSFATYLNFSIWVLNR